MHTDCVLPTPPIFTFLVDHLKIRSQANGKRLKDVLSILSTNSCWFALPVGSNFLLFFSVFPSLCSPICLKTLNQQYSI